MCIPFWQEAILKELCPDLNPHGVEFIQMHPFHLLEGEGESHAIRLVLNLFKCIPSIFLKGVGESQAINGFCSV